MSDIEADRFIAWAKRLAFNIGIYNLVLALGLAWTCWAFATQAPTAKSLGIFFAVWLLGAAAAAISTQIVMAFIVQGALGVLLLIAARPSSDAAVARLSRYRAGWSSRNTIWVGRTKCKATSRITSTVLMYISAMASTE